MVSLKRIPASNERAMRLEKLRDVILAVAHGLIQGIHAVAVPRVKTGGPLLHQHSHLCSGGGG